jgi:hypothetical protein
MWRENDINGYGQTKSKLLPQLRSEDGGISMDDLISRQAVKELAHNQMREKYCGMALKKQRDFYIKLADSIIDLLPSIQPKRGRWHYSDGKPARIGLSFGVICDQCGTESEYCTNFCGECGADMRQREE